MPKQSKL